MTGGLLHGDVFRGLAFRILLFLTLALLPFGLISIFQTREIARQDTFNSELSLVALTNDAVSQERAMLLEAFGTAQTLAAVVKRSAGDPALCSEFLAEYTTRSDHFVFAGFVPTDGYMTCSSGMAPVQFGGTPEFEERMADQSRLVQALDQGAVSARSVITVTQPVFEGETFLGYMAVSIPQERIQRHFSDLLTTPPLDVVTFNTEGDIVKSNSLENEIGMNLPANRALQALVGRDSLVFNAESANGEERVYAVVPIVSDVAYALSIWRPEDLKASFGKAIGLSIFMPILMWLASLVVAFWSLNRLAVRHIRKLGRQMRRFAYNRRVPEETMGTGVPIELAEIQQSFVRMADSIVRDEAALENSLREKNILLKEVHHRVKNNLQLISSIMNMQIRRAQSDDARAVLKRLQDRILSLATVHRNLYQNDTLERVDAGALIDEIVGQLLRVGLSAGRRVEVVQTYDSVFMDADDAAPLTLLVSEAVTNAMKFIGQASNGNQARLDISLKKSGDRDLVFRVANTFGSSENAEKTGLGSQLINAFSRQLNGHVETHIENDEHVLVLTFPIQERSGGFHDF